MSWGIKITILYLGFVSIILTLVFTCFGHKTELEFKDYYAREIKFQDQIDARNNAERLLTPISYSVQSKSVLIEVPQELADGATGNILFLRPSDQQLDRSIPFMPGGGGIQVVEGIDFKTGPYKMQLSISKDSKNYYKEAVINFR